MNFSRIALAGLGATVAYVAIGALVGVFAAGGVIAHTYRPARPLIEP